MKKKTKKLKIKKIGILVGYGEYCDCLEKGYDCVVLYGGKCERDVPPLTLKK